MGSACKGYINVGDKSSSTSDICNNEQNEHIKKELDELYQSDESDLVYGSVDLENGLTGIEIKIPVIK
jgi:hypothetical protein